MRSIGSFLGFDTIEEVAAVEEVVAEVALVVAAAEEREGRLFFLEPPPTGTFLRDPPSVQYLLQVLQKYRG